MRGLRWGGGGYKVGGLSRGTGVYSPMSDRMILQGYDQNENTLKT